MRLPAMAAMVGMLLALCAPARAQSSRGFEDDEAASKARPGETTPAGSLRAVDADGAVGPQEILSEEDAQAVASGSVAAQDARTGEPGDTLVVPARGPDQPGFTMVGENVFYDDPSFVPYKLRAAARRARASVDIATIP